MNILKQPSGLLLLLLMLVQQTMKGQHINVGGIFPTIDHSGSLSSKTNYSLYYFAAFPIDNFDKADKFRDSYFHLFYAEHALSYSITNGISVTGSYVYQRSNPVYKDYVNENRFYLQAKYKHSIKKISVQHRVRFDGRFIENRISGKNPFSHRVRYLIGAEIPFNEKTYLSIYEEAFFNTSGKNAPTYAENWAYAALGKKINETHKIEAGLLFVTWNIGKNNWFNQYYLQFTWISHLNFNKPKK